MDSGMLNACAYGFEVCDDSVLPEIANATACVFCYVFAFYTSVECSNARRYVIVRRAVILSVTTYLTSLYTARIGINSLGALVLFFIAYWIYEIAISLAYLFWILSVADTAFAACTFNRTPVWLKRTVWGSWAACQCIFSGISIGIAASGDDCGPWEVSLNIYLVFTTFLIGLPLLLTYGTLYRHLRNHVRTMQRLAADDLVVVSRPDPSAPGGLTQESTSIVIRKVAKKIGKFTVVVLVISIIWLAVLLGKDVNGESRCTAFDIILSAIARVAKFFPPIWYTWVKKRPPQSNTDSRKPPATVTSPLGSPRNGGGAGAKASQRRRTLLGDDRKALGVHLPPSDDYSRSHSSLTHSSSISPRKCHANDSRSPTPANANASANTNRNAGFVVRSHERRSTIDSQSVYERERDDLRLGTRTPDSVVERAGGGGGHHSEKRRSAPGAELAAHRSSAHAHAPPWSRSASTGVRSPVNNGHNASSPRGHMHAPRGVGRKGLYSTTPSPPPSVDRAGHGSDAHALVAAERLERERDTPSPVTVELGARSTSPQHFTFNTSVKSDSPPSSTGSPVRPQRPPDVKTEAVYPQHPISPARSSNSPHRPPNVDPQAVYPQRPLSPARSSNSPQRPLSVETTPRRSHAGRQRPLSPVGSRTTPQRPPSVETSPVMSSAGRQRPLSPMVSRTVPQRPPSVETSPVMSSAGRQRPLSPMVSRVRTPPHRPRTAEASPVRSHVGPQRSLPPMESHAHSQSPLSVETAPVISHVRRQRHLSPEGSHAYPQGPLSVETAPASTRPYSHSHRPRYAHSRKGMPTTPQLLAKRPTV